MNIQKLGLAGLAVTLLLGGCAYAPQGELPDDPAYSPMLPQSPRPDFAGNEGGMQYARFGTSLFSDRRALAVGDIVTVRLQERTQASKDASTDINKDSTIDMSADPFLGQAAPYNGFDVGTSTSASRTFGGDASSTQSNSLNGNITVSVVEVMPNGLLRVRGEKWMQLNRGQEYVRLTGIMRQQDIQPDNSIASAKLADVRIAYSGEGELAQSNNMGWLSKFFNSGWWPL